MFPSQSKPSVLIVDDHDIVRFGLEMLIHQTPDLRVVGTAASLHEAVQRIAELTPDLVVTDMSLGLSRGLATVRSVVAAQAGRAVLVVSMHDQLLYAEQVLAVGAHGYIMKEHAHADVVLAARTVLRGEPWVGHAVSARLLGRLGPRQPARSVAAGPAQGATQPLTSRELEVLERLGRGWTTKEIAFDLDLSPRTIDIHRASLKNKLGFRSGAELMAFAAASA